MIRQWGIGIAMLATAGAGAHAATAWTSADNNRNNYTTIGQGTYTPVVLASDQDGGSGWSVQNPDGRPSLGFADFFNDSDTIDFLGVNVGAATGSQQLAVAARAGNGALATFRVDFFASGQLGGTPVASHTATRFRSTGWQTNAFTFAPLTGGVAQGTYDIRITNLSGGSHLAGLGLWSPQHTLSTAGATTIQVEDYAWADGGRTLNGNDHPTGTGRWIDNDLQSSSNWLDYEVFNPDAATPYTFAINLRGNPNLGAPDFLPAPIGFDLKLVETDGDVSANIAQLATTGTGGWGGSPFVWSNESGQFFLPQGHSTLRIMRTPGTAANHWDALRFTAVPEPASLALLALGGLAIAGRRRG